MRSYFVSAYVLFLREVMKIHPSIDDLTRYEELCQIIKKPKEGTAKEDTKLSLRQAADQLGLTPSVLIACLDRLEEEESRKKGKEIQLIERDPQGGGLAITPAGASFLGIAKRTLEVHREFSGEQPNKLAAGMTDTFFIRLLPGKWIEEYLQEEKNVRLSLYLDQSFNDLTWKMRQGEREFGIGAAMEKPPSWIVTEPFYEASGKVIAFDRVLVCGPKHRWATAISKGEMKSVTLEQLKDEDVAYRPLSQHPTSDEIPAGSGRRLEVDTYDATVALARLGVACGIVPAFPWWLDPLRNEGALVYVPVVATKEHPVKKTVPTLYLKTARKDLAPEPAKLIKAIEKHLQSLPRSLAWAEVKKPPQLPTLPTFYKELKYVYYVSHEGQSEVLPKWFYAALTSWEVVDHKKANIASGSKKELKSSDTPPTFLIMRGQMDTCDAVYEVYGSLLGPDIFSLTGITPARGKQGEDRFVAVFNTSVIHNTEQTLLWGVWTGRDENGRATTGPMIISSKELEVEHLREITRCAQCNVLPNAEYGLDRKVKPSRR